MYQGHPLLVFPHKQLRAQVIYAHAKEAGYKGIVVLSCGNASKALQEVAGDSMEVVAPEPEHWLTHEEIAQTYPGYFDATSGHLPLWLMVRIAAHFKAWFDQRGGLERGRYTVPTGSGETITCLLLAYPNTFDHTFTALYNFNKGSQYEPLAPLNQVVETLFEIEDYDA